MSGLGGLVSGLFGGGEQPELPSVKAENLRKTATAVDQTPEDARKKRLREASFLTRGLDAPRLSNPGLLGL